MSEVTLAKQAVKILLFGQIGSGKSFVGEFLQREFGIAYYDADRDLPRALVEAVRNHQPISERMRDQFTQRIIERVRVLQEWPQEFCLAQALFKNRHRFQLLQEFPGLHFVWVRSPDPLLNTRLQDRTGHIASHYYAQIVNPQFEPPSMPHWILENSSDPAELRVRVVRLVASLRSD